MDEDGVSPQVPLLTNNREFELGSVNKTPFLVSAAKCILKTLLWTISVAWVTLIFIFPSTFVQQIYLDWIEDGTGGGLTATVFVLFSGPILALAFLSVVYLHLSSSDDHPKKKNPKFPKFCLRTFPVLVDGPFGVVSAAEFIGILLFVVYIIWSVASYAIQNYNTLADSDYTSQAKSLTMLELTGFSFGQIGLLCLAFLFLPVARGSVLLRVINVPFEQAIRYHVWLGHLTMVIFTLHGACYIVAWSLEHSLLSEMLQWADSGVATLAGVISFSAGLLMWVTSLPIVRKQIFELFFYTHQLYVVFFVFMAFHVGDFSFAMVAGPIFLFILDRFLRFCQSRRAVNVVSAKCLPCGTVEIVLSKPKNLRYNALSFLFLQVREVSWLQWHPFSVSSSPLDGENHLSILIKATGKWTTDLKDNISSSQEELMRPLSSLPHRSITASVEGPYGHESAYHLTYENLILVAGGIGISPFIAILRDILHHFKEKKHCLPEKILVIWAIKRSKELSLLYESDLGSICPFYHAKLQLEIQIYVTQESDPPLEDGKVYNSIQRRYLQNAKMGTAISSLVGTGNNTWSGIYAIVPIIGFIVFLALTDVFYIKPFGIASSWFTGLLFVACMITSVVIFGGLVVVCWDLSERGDSGNRKNMEEDNSCEQLEYNEPIPSSTASPGTHASITSTQYGRRPNFQEIFHSISERWSHVHVGVIVCGPPTLQSTVAKECRVHNIRGRRNQPFFHFNSHSFEL